MWLILLWKNMCGMFLHRHRKYGGAPHVRQWGAEEEMVGASPRRRDPLLLLYDRYFNDHVRLHHWQSFKYVLHVTVLYKTLNKENIPYPLESQWRYEWWKCDRCNLRGEIIYCVSTRAGILKHLLEAPFRSSVLHSYLWSSALQICFCVCCQTFWWRFWSSVSQVARLLPTLLFGSFTCQLQTWAHYE